MGEKKGRDVSCVLPATAYKLAAGTLPHVHFRSTTLVMNLIHKLLHQQDASPVLSSEIFGSERVGHSGGIEAWAFVANHQRHAHFVVTLATNVDFFARIFAVAVKDCISERFTKRQLDREFAARIAMIFANLEH